MELAGTNMDLESAITNLLEGKWTGDGRTEGLAVGLVGIGAHKYFCGHGDFEFWFVGP